MRGLGLAPFWEDQLMSSEVPIEIEDKPTAVSIMRELVEHLQDTIEALKREVLRNPKSDEYRKRTLHHRQTNLGAGGGKSIALTIKGSNAIALPTHGSGRFGSRATVYDPTRTCRLNGKRLQPRGQSW